MVKLKDTLHSKQAAKEYGDRVAADREQERQRIRAKLSEADRKFMDAVIAQFQGARVVGIRFADGEQIGVDC